MNIPCEILSRLINIDPERQWYTGIYDFLRSTVMSGLKKDEDFNMLRPSTKLSGSYVDNLKISKPDEFDVLIHFDLPKEDFIHIERDEEYKGNVLINLMGLLNELKDSRHDENMLCFLEKLVDNRGYLLQNKFHSWLESCMAKFLRTIDHRIVYENKEYKLIYRKSGPAHTLYVQNIEEDKPLFSVDFVPAFRFEANRSVSTIHLQSGFWEAIPRPLKCTRHRDNPSFRTSYTDFERNILANKDNLKTVLRFMKKFRNNTTRMQHLKSYYIKTLFLWLVHEVDETYWRKPVFEITRKAFKRLEDALFTREIKFFWDADLNMLQNTLKDTQIMEMHREVAKLNKFLDQPCSRKKFLRYFLSEAELACLTTDDENRITADSLEEEDTSSDKLLYSFIGAYALIIGYQIYKLIKI